MGEKNMLRALLQQHRVKLSLHVLWRHSTCYLDVNLGHDYSHAEEMEVLAERTDEHIRQGGLLPDHWPMHTIAHIYKSTFKHIHWSVWSSTDGDLRAPFTSVIQMGFGDQLAVHQSHESSQYSRNTLRMDCTQFPNPLPRVVGDALWPHWTHL